ncbi:hypothetical protein LX36DRAFT_305953 [Colletotrichum falcatum]|nr:hypothetical protein LX36DRAFT_305953 [Colletotrichum falcatum]
MRAPTVVSFVASAQTECVSCKNEQFRASNDTNSKPSPKPTPAAGTELFAYELVKCRCIPPLSPTNIKLRWHGLAPSPAQPSLARVWQEDPWIPTDDIDVARQGCGQWRRVERSSRLLAAMIRIGAAAGVGKHKKVDLHGDSTYYLRNHTTHG